MEDCYGDITTQSEESVSRSNTYVIGGSRADSLPPSSRKPTIQIQAGPHQGPPFLCHRLPYLLLAEDLPITSELNTNRSSNNKHLVSDPSVQILEANGHRSISSFEVTNVMVLYTIAL